MRMVLCLLVVGCLATALRAETPESVGGPAPENGKTRFLVHLNVSPTRNRDVERIVRTAKALCADDTHVTVFVDLDAVVLAAKELPSVDAKERQRVGVLVNELLRSGAEILVCPHCAATMGITRENLPQGMRFTDETEYGELQKNADTTIQVEQEPGKQPETLKSA